LFLSGLVMTVLTLSGIGAQVWFRRRLVKEFSYDGSVLRFRPSERQRRKPVIYLKLRKLPSGEAAEARKAIALRFLDGQKIYLQYSVTNSFAVAEEMRRAAMRQ